MPKAEFGTPKWMSNRIKASGLQKLRWYCQMCQKQCRDENGFKCHRMSEGHQRAMQLFIQRPGQFMDEFSHEFEQEFMKLMKTRYCRTRVLANSVYNNVVCDRHHIHMNSTIWYLGATEKCKIEHTPKGWYVEYIDHEELAKKKEEEKRRKIEKSQEEACMERIQELVEKAKERGGFKEPKYTPLRRDPGQQIALSVNWQQQNAKGQKTNVLETLRQQLKQERQVKSSDQQKRKLSAMEELVEEAERRKQRAAAFESSALSDRNMTSAASRPDDRKRGSQDETRSNSQPQPPPHKYADADWWVRPGLVVKVVHKTLAGGKYYKQKAVIKAVDGRYCALLEMLEGRDILKVDQEYLETVIPAVQVVHEILLCGRLQMKSTGLKPIGGRVIVVLGQWRGHEGRLEALDIASFSAQVTLDQGPLFKLNRYKDSSGVYVAGLPYENICKLDVRS